LFVIPRLCYLQPLMLGIIFLIPIQVRSDFLKQTPKDFTNVQLDGLTK
jgi:hypothetical protein